VKSQLRLQCRNASDIAAWSPSYADNHVINLRILQIFGHSGKNGR
jgi:hypothetical protein